MEESAKERKVGEIVYYIAYNLLRKGVITEIQKSTKSVVIDDLFIVPESRVYDSKEELWQFLVDVLDATENNRLDDDLLNGTGITIS